MTHPLKHLLSASPWDATVCQRLESSGMSKLEARQKMSGLRHCGQILHLNHKLPDTTEVSCHFVPGRIEVVGKHTDYAGGRSLLCAVQRGFAAVMLPRADDHIRLTEGQGQQLVEFPLSPDVPPDMSSWAGYPQVVARRVARNFPAARRGMDVAFVSDLPRASGMSSSSALVVLLFRLLAQANDIDQSPEYRHNISTPEDLAGYLGTIENGQTFKSLIGDRGVGTFGGSEDHTAILLSKPNKLVQYAYCPVRKEREVDWPEGYTFVIASSGVIAEKAAGAMASYNNASLLARAALDEWNRATGRQDATLAAAIQAAGRDAITGVLARSSKAGELTDRFDQFFVENEQIVTPFADVLARRDWKLLGELSDRSQSLSETKLKNQVPQTAFLAKSARELGALAASAFGAGFGGSVWAIIRDDEVKPFLESWRTRYAAAYPQDAARSEFFPTRPGPAAMRL